MKVKTFTNITLTDLGIEIEKFINQFKDIEIISQSHSSVYIPKTLKGGVEVGGHENYTVIIIYK